jgi:hypothetical protein
VEVRRCRYVMDAHTEVTDPEQEHQTFFRPPVMTTDEHGRVEFLVEPDGA